MPGRLSSQTEKCRPETSAKCPAWKLGVSSLRITEDLVDIHTSRLVDLKTCHDVKGTSGGYSMIPLIWKQHPPPPKLHSTYTLTYKDM